MNKLIGTRVELHPGCDLWMRGARFGTIVGVEGDLFKVRVDGVKKLQRFPADRLRSAFSKAEYDHLRGAFTKTEYGLGYMQGRGAA